MKTAKNSRDLINGVFEGADYDRVPIWFMRQAGRYLPEYMAIREKSSFEERSQTPEVAAEITLQPVERFDMDAAIIFSDILIPIYGMDKGLQIIPKVGPRIPNPIRDPQEVDDLIIPTAAEDFPYLQESIELVRKEIPDKGLIGFSGAPFTLASYLIEGKSTKTGGLTKAFAFKYPDAFDRLMQKLVDIICDQLQVQIDGGVDFVQIFDSWAGHLSPTQFEQLSLPYLQQILQRITDVPIIFFSRGSYHILPRARELQADGFSIDPTLTLTAARKLVGDSRLLQGNLDPAYLMTRPELVREQTLAILQEAQANPHFIFNLGTGIDKSSDLDNVGAMVETVKSFRRTEL